MKQIKKRIIFIIVTVAVLATYLFYKVNAVQRNISEIKEEEVASIEIGSLANDFAYIWWVFNNDHTFNLDIELSNIDAGTPVKLNYQGNWKIEKRKLIATFKEADGEDIKGFFDRRNPGWDGNSRVKNNNLVEIKYGIKSLWIYGTLCRVTYIKR